MAVTNFSPLLGFALPTTGDLSGTWGVTVNDSITSLIDSAVAGTTTLSADADVTLSTTNGAANQARNAVILWTASNGATTRNVTAPAQSKAYVVINAGTGSVVIRGSGPTTGVTVTSGTKALVAWNGSDFVKIASTLVNLASEVTGTLPIANGGTGTTSTTFANLTTNVTGTLPIANGGTGTTSTTFANLTTNVTGILPVANGGTATATPGLVQGSNITITGTWPNQTIAAAAPGSGTVTAVSVASSNGFAGTSSGGATPALTLSTSITGVLKGNGTAISAATAGTDYVAPGGALGTPASGDLTSCTADGTDAVGFRNIPQNSQSAAYTLVLADAGKHIFHPVGDNNARTFTIPANGSVAYPIGTAITFINMAVANVTIAITTDTLTLSPAGTTGSRTLATNGSATCIKITSTSWLISGSGLT
jgi:hypothetical protein